MEAQPVSEKRALLKSVFGYEGFRPGQEQLIDALLQGRDAMGIMPTGAGKSVCYQVPGVVMDGLALVVSPLVSLMGDQVCIKSSTSRPSGCSRRAFRILRRA